MKKRYSALAAAIFLGAAISVTKAQVQVSVDFFHDNLESYGDWREVGDYGYCWHPRNVGRNWRPYSDGRWLYTDAGWTWDSEEPYSWAVYHYGRWARVDRIGWVWVPGTEWGPAWVSWRRSPRYVGWAPLPPDAEFSRSVGFNTRVDAEYDIGPTNYSFVDVRNFGAPRLRTVIIEPRENITIISQTTNITRITYVNNVVYNEGPQYDVISRESAQPIRRLQLERRDVLNGDPRTVRAEQLRTSVEGDSFRVAALPFDTKPATAPRKVAAKVGKAEVDHGWKNAGPPAEVAKFRGKIKSESATPAELPPQSKTEKPAEAPAVSAVPPPVPDKKPAKGKASKGGQPESPAASVATETAPASPEKPVAPDKPAQPGKAAKGTKPVKPEASSPRPSPPAGGKTEPPRQPKKTTVKESGTPRLPAEAVPKEQVQGEKPKTGNVEAKRKLPPAPVETPRPKIHSGKGDAPPKLEQPKKQEPRPQAKKPESRPPATPAVTQPQPAKGKAKGKGKDENKDAVKPDVAPQKRSEPRQQAAPAATKPQPPQPAKGKGKGKGKDEKKDDDKPDGATK